MNFILRKFPSALLLILLLGFALRLGLALHLGINNPPPHPGSDQDEYDCYAWNLAQGRGFRGPSPNFGRDNLTAYRVPGTSLVWASLYKFLGHRYDAVRVLHCIVGSLTILLVYVIGKRCFSHRVGLLAAAIYAVWPTALFYSTELLSEPLAIFWFSAFIASALRFAEKPSWWEAVATGLFLGFSILTRAGFVLMIPLVVFWIGWTFWCKPAALTKAALIPVCALLTLLPWGIRNYRLFHAVVPLANEGGDTLLGGNNDVVANDPKYYGHQIYPTSIDEYRVALDACTNEVQRNRLGTSLAVDWLRNHPDKWWYLTESKFRRLWTPLLQPTSPSLWRYGTLLSWGPILILFIPAFFQTLVVWFRGHSPSLLIHLAIIHVQLTALVFAGISRFRFPIEGLCIVLAAQSCALLYSGIRRIEGVTP